VVPKTIDIGTVVPLTEAIVVNLLLMSLFAIQHSVMARPRFKARLARLITFGGAIALTASPAGFQ